MSGVYDNPFFYQATGGMNSGLTFDEERNNSELLGDATLYTITGFPGSVPQGGIQSSIDLSTKVITPTLQAKFGGVPIWIWFVAAAVAALFYFKK